MTVLFLRLLFSITKTKTTKRREVAGRVGRAAQEDRQGPRDHHQVSCSSSSPKAWYKGWTKSPSFRAPATPQGEMETSGGEVSVYGETAGGGLGSNAASNQVVVDALPYIDLGYDEPGVREAVSCVALLLVSVHMYYYLLLLDMTVGTT